MSDRDRQKLIMDKATNCVVCHAKQNSDKKEYCFGCANQAILSPICPPPSSCAKFVKCPDTKCEEGRWVCDKPECQTLAWKPWFCFRCCKNIECIHQKWSFCVAPVTRIPETGDGTCCSMICEDCSKESPYCAQHVLLHQLVNNSYYHGGKSKIF